MAINFTVSYTFAPSTTISSSQVNTNFSDEANVWTGLEALTKTFAKLKVDVDPSTALEVATKQYVDHYSTYRRPALQYSSTTVVVMETGLTGTAGHALILFPDGNLRDDSTGSRINGDISRVAALSGTAQSGLRTGTVANNTWYAVYAVKVTDNSSNFVMVFDTVLPTQANYATLNSNFGTSGWVYLGLIRYSDQNGTNAILKFVQSGNRTFLYNKNSGNEGSIYGILMATTAGATTLTYTYSAGTSGATIPSTIYLGIFHTASGGFASGRVQITAQSSATQIGIGGAVTSVDFDFEIPTLEGVVITTNPLTSVPHDITLRGWTDSVLGVGSNPLL